MKGKFMEENQIQNDLEMLVVQAEEPALVENSEAEATEVAENTLEQLEEEGQSFEADDAEKDPTEELILGKFKSVEDLVKAYEDLQ